MATITVTTSLDTVDAGDGLTSLREAVANATAAAAICNLGTLSGVAAVTAANSATVGLGHQAGRIVAPGGTRGLLGAGGAAGGDRLDAQSRDGSLTPPFDFANTFGPNGTDGTDGIAGAAVGFGPKGTKSDGILTEATGTTTAADGNALIHLHGLTHGAVQAGGKISCNIIRIGDCTSEVTVQWRLVPNGANGAAAADFIGGLASGHEVLADNPDTNVLDRPGNLLNPSRSVHTVSIDVKADGLVEVPEGYGLVLTSVSSGAGSVSVLLGTRVWTGQIIDAYDLPIPTEGNDQLNGGAADDTLDAPGGKAGRDSLSGGAGDDHRFGGRRDDSLTGGAGNDLLQGGLGVNTACYSDAKAAVAVNLTLTRAQDTRRSGIDTILNCDNLTGSAFNDTLVGNDRANVITGGARTDRLIGNLGADVLWGGPGADRFVFNAARQSTHTSEDTIRDFSHARGDRIDLRGFDIDPVAAGHQGFTFVTSGPLGHRTDNLCRRRASGRIDRRWRGRFRYPVLRGRDAWGRDAWVR